MFVLQPDEISRFANTIARADAVEIQAGASLLFSSAPSADYSNTQAETAVNASVFGNCGGTLTFTRGTVTTQEILK